jgi:hypothetical protein
MKRLLLILCVAFILVRCATIHYLGDSYPPTQHVDLYFSEDDVQKEYKVIGRIEATADADELIYSTDKFTEAIREKAQAKGADGVIILDFRNVQTGITENNDHTRTSVEKHNRRITHEHETSSSTVEEKRRVEAIAIRYAE